jgi:hypothetical protein
VTRKRFLETQFRSGSERAAKPSSALGTRASSPMASVDSIQACADAQHRAVVDEALGERFGRRGRAPSPCRRPERELGSARCDPRRQRPHVDGSGLEVRNGRRLDVERHRLPVEFRQPRPPARPSNSHLPSSAHARAR